MTIGSLQYFTTVGLHSSYLLVIMTVAAGSAVALLIADPSKGAEAIGPLALVQMFAAASGFAVPARRGHFDLLLTGGTTRLAVALTHFAISVAPGLCLWLLVGLVEMMAAHTLTPKAFASGTVVVFILMSGPTWALTVGLPRLSGAIGWLLVMATWRAAALADHGVVAVALCPYVVLGQHLTGEQTRTVFPAIVLALLLPALAIAWIVRMDVPLESAQ